MDNKLSKPVMYVVRTLDGSVASVKSHSYTAPKGFTSEPLYSQEYVSALLAERDAFEASALALRDEWRARGERIAELEINEKQMLRDHYCAEDVLARQRNDYESALEGMYEAVTGKCPAWGCGFGSDEAVKEVAQIHAELSRLLAHNIERAEGAEKRLATPVRLPETYSPEPWMGPDPSGTWLEKEDVKDSIRAAGFTVEGDE